MQLDPLGFYFIFDLFIGTFLRTAFTPIQFIFSGLGFSLYEELKKGAKILVVTDFLCGHEVRHGKNQSSASESAKSLPKWGPGHRYVGPRAGTARLKRHISITMEFASRTISPVTVPDISRYGSEGDFVTSLAPSPFAGRVEQRVEHRGAQRRPRAVPEHVVAVGPVRVDYGAV